MDISEEKKARELQYEKILHDYQSKKHSLASAKEREARKTSELFAKDASSHNLGRLQRKVSATCYNLLRSFVILLESSKRCEM